MRIRFLVGVTALACSVASSDVRAAPSVLSLTDLTPEWSRDEARFLPSAIESEDWPTVRNGLLKSSAGSRKASELAHRRFLLGYACLQTGDPLGAITVLQGLERDAPRIASWVGHLRGQALFALGRFPEALDALVAVPPDSPLYRDAQSLAGDAQSALGRHALAAEAWERSGRRDPEAVGKHAQAMAAAGRQKDALSLLRRAYYRSAASGRKAYRAAMDALGFAADPQPAELVEHAQALLDAHMNKDAEREATPLIQSPDAETRCRALLIRGLARQKLRQHPEALQDFTPLIEQCGAHVDTARALFLAIRSAYRGGERERGDRLADRLKTDFPGATFNDDVALMRARTAVSRGDPATATRVLEESLTAWPDGDMADETRWLLAWASYKGKDLPAALARLREGARVATNPDYRSRFAYWEARVLQRLGRTDEARTAYEATVLAHPLKYHAWLALNRLVDASGKKATLVGVLDALLKDQPRGPRFLTLADPSRLESGAIGRAVWLSRAGLPALAARELAQAERDADTDARWLGAWLLDLGGRYTRSHRLATTLLAESPSYWPNAASRGYFHLAYPRPHLPQVQAAAQEAGIETALIWGVMRQESAFVAGVESRANAIGLMQLILPTARAMAKRLDLTATPQSLRRPEINIRLGAQYLSSLLKRFEQPLTAIPGYNAGGGAIAKGLSAHPGIPLDEFVETIGAEETRNYARKVFESYAAYRFLYNQGGDRFSRIRFGRK